MSQWTKLVVACALLVLGSLQAQEPKATPAKEDPAHEDLRALRKGLTEAVNHQDLDALLSHLDKDVVVTWQNGEVSVKPEGVRAYYDRMMKGPNRIVESVSVDPTVDELTHLYGDTGVAYGSSKDHFKLTDGKDFDMLTRWSATLVKKDGKWLVANFHASTNMFDNPLLYIAIRRTAYWVGGIAVLVGLALGFILARLLRKSSPAAGTSAPPAGQ
jgi:ketosteroid isomerase-like protein